MTAGATAAVAARVSRAPRVPRYVALGAFMVVVALAGFWPQYYGRVATGEALTPRVSFWAIHVHSALFLGWLLLFLAAWSVAMVPFGRLLGRYLGVQHQLTWQPAILAPLVVAIGWDWAARRRLHPAWVIGLVLFVARANRRPLMETEAWQSIGRALLAPFL